VVSIPVFQWIDPPGGPAVALLDQTRLPAEEMVLTCGDVPSLVDAIRRLVVRGAPLLGVAGAFGVALAARRGDDVAQAVAQIEQARPTAVNLSWGARRAYAAYQRGLSGEPAGSAARAATAVLTEARSIAAQDAAASEAMAARGLAFVPEAARILTHCNTGSLVSAGEGTAFAVILAAHRAGRLSMLWIDETRPLLQGARLTAYEAVRAGMPHAVLADSASAALMAAGQVDLVLTGAWPTKSEPTDWRSWRATTRCRLSWWRRCPPSIWLLPSARQLRSSNGPPWRSRTWPGRPSLLLAPAATIRPSMSRHPSWSPLS
jgi:methylthioribose-1-phosphate isomerase